MKSNQSKIVLSAIVAAVFSLMAGCASVPSAEFTADESQVDLIADLKP